MRIWGKLWSANHLLRDMTVEDAGQDTRTHKVLHAVDRFCESFDLSRPIWLDSNIAEFKRHSKTRFGPDNFIDSIDFDYLEIQVIEED